MLLLVCAGIGTTSYFFSLSFSLERVVQYEGDELFGTSYSRSIFICVLSQITESIKQQQHYNIIIKNHKFLSFLEKIASKK